MATEPPARLSLAERPVTLVDSSVILDVVTEDPVWAGWSADALAEAADEGLLVINPIVYAEISVGFDRVEDLDEPFPPMTSDTSRCRTRRASWQARHSWPTTGGAARSVPHSRIST